MILHDPPIALKYREAHEIRINNEPRILSQPSSHITDSASYPNPTRAWYALGVLTLVYVFSFLDRQILNLLVVPVSRDLQISDTQMSLLIGVAFAIFYTAFGLPLGRVADSHSRRGLIGAGFALWSLFTAGCGFAGNYAQLLVMRMGVGVGEASLSPAAYSLITDYFPPRRRGAAQGIYNMGIYIGSGIALVLGALAIGWLSKRPQWDLPLIGVVRWWQVLFMVMGAAGLLLVPLMLTVKEPPRHGASAQSVPFGEVLSHFRTSGNLSLSQRRYRAPDLFRLRRPRLESDVLRTSSWLDRRRGRCCPGSHRCSIRLPGGFLGRMAR